MLRKYCLLIITMIAFTVSLRALSRSIPLTNPIRSTSSHTLMRNGNRIHFHNNVNNINIKALSTSSSSLSSSSRNKESLVPISHPSYDILGNEYISEYDLIATLYAHKKTKAEVVSIQAKDENKVFGITFRTPPNDSTGIPHILEHSVLCGSRNYPVKEPFVELLKGSLQNFLNAFTYPDRTCYPVASTNLKDFYNLIRVYMDAVLYPRAMQDKKVFEQEGWHYELENPADPLTFKGVVYNEMKGVYSSQDSLLDRATQRALFPDNTYNVDSGGDPVVIPKLTFEQFKEFHSKYYHPSNSRIFFYGDDDIAPRLDLVDEYLAGFGDRKEVCTRDSKVHFQPKRLQPTKHQVSVPLGQGSSGKQACTVNWLMNDGHLSARDALALAVLDHLLMGTPSSSLRKVLTDSQLGESVTGGLSDELIQNTYSIGLKGVPEGRLGEVEVLVLKTLANLAKEGFHEDAIQASINTLEFKLREFNTGSFPRGLSVMLSMLSHWIYDRSPLTSISFESALSELKEDILAGKPVFQNLIKEYFVNNHHRVTMEMIPDKEMENRIIQEEEQTLAAVKQSLTPSQLDEIIESTKQLKAAQLAVDSPEAKATIPKLSLADIDPKAREIPIDVERRGDGVTILSHTLPSNGILYCDVAFDLKGIEFDDLAILSLFQKMVLESGTNMNDEVTLSRKIGANTGGIWTGRYIDRRYSEGKVSYVKDDAMIYFTIQGKAVGDKIDTLLALMTEILLGANLNNQQKAIDILKESKINKQTSVVSSGHSYASARIAAKHTLIGAINEKTSGLTAVRDASALLTLAEHSWPELAARLEALRRRFLHGGALVINLTGDEDTLSRARQSLPAFIGALPSPPAGGQSPTSDKYSILEQWSATHPNGLFVPQGNEGFIVPSQVNYVGKGGPIYLPGEVVSGASSVFTHQLGTGYLWDNVRVVGGAYGGFARFSESAGMFTYLSYRDPNLLETLAVYDGTSQSILHDEHGGLHPDELTQSIIGTVGDLDSPMTVDQKGFVSMTRYLRGEPAEFRQQWRNEVLGTTEKDFRDIATRLQVLQHTGTAVVFGSEKALQDAQASPSCPNMTVEPAFVDVASQEIDLEGMEDV